MYKKVLVDFRSMSVELIFAQAKCVDYEELLIGLHQSS
jgi:hypothetical protein